MIFDAVVFFFKLLRFKSHFCLKISDASYIQDHIDDCETACRMHYAKGILGQYRKRLLRSKNMSAGDGLYLYDRQGRERNGKNMKRDSNDRKGDGKDMKLDSKDMKGHGKDLEKGRKETERDDKSMKKERENRKWSMQCGGRMLIAAVMAAMVLCMGCSSSEETTGSDNAENPADTAETPVSQDEGVTAQPEAAQPDNSETEEASEPEETGSEEAAEPENTDETDKTDETDEWTAWYNEYQAQGALYFTMALCEAGYDQICLVNGNSDVTNYFSVKDGNYYTFPEEKSQVLLYVPYIPAEYSCDNENIKMYYWYKERENAEDYLINSIALDCIDFEGDDVPVNISVTFEDGSTQEITVYLTRHAEAE